MISVDRMRWVDRYVGLPLCWLLTANRWLCARLGGRPAASPRRILIIKCSEMGSTVLAYPALAALRDKIADLDLLFLTFAPNRALLDTLKFPVRVFAIDVSSPVRMLRTTVQVLWQLRRERIDATIDMDFFSRFSAIIAYLVCRRSRVGFHRFTTEGLGRGRLLTHPVMYSTHTHTAAAFMALIEALDRPDSHGLNTRARLDVPSSRIPVHEPERSTLDAVRRRLTGDGLSPDMQIVLINPNSSDLFPLRRWPLSRFAELCAALLDEFDDIGLVITGTASEQADARAILDRVRDPRCVSFAGRTSFPELLALYSLAAALVTNDSGPAHFAALLRTPTVVLFGPETPALYGPLNPNARNLYAHFACSPCVSVHNAKKSPCTRSLCLEAISVSEVVSQVRSILTAPMPEKCERRGGSF